MDPRLLDVASHPVTVDEVHAVLTEIAAELANRDPALPRAVYPSGEAFFPTPHRSRKGGLCLSYDPLALAGLKGSERGRFVRLMRGIGTRAMNRTLRENADVIARLVVGEARAGRNYLDRF